MKIKLSISVDEDTALKVMENVRKGRFRNKSHAVEFALTRMLKEKEEEEQ